MRPTEEVVVGSVDDVLPAPQSGGSTIDSPRNNVFIRRSGNETLLIGLKYPCALYFQGILEVNVLAGKMISCGYVASSSDSRLPLRVFSLKEGSAQFLSTTKDSHIFASEIVKFDHCKEFSDTIQEILECVRPVGCIICVSSKKKLYQHWNICLDRHKLEMFPNIQKAFGFPLFAEAERILDCQLDVYDGSRILGKLKISDEFEEVCNEILSGFQSQSDGDPVLKTILCGGKGVGKSSYLKYIINKCLNHTSSVLYIDLDIGQPEFTLCGCVSAVIIDAPLIGPNYSHLKQPLRSYYVGDANPMQCLRVYINAVSQLFKFCYSNEQCRSMPWFVNTMGMTKGLGLDIIAMVISYLKPDHVIQIISQQKQDNFSVLLTPCFLRDYSPNINCEPLNAIDFRYHEVSSISKTQTRSVSLPSAAKLRELQAVIYFSKMLSQEDVGVGEQWVHKCADGTFLQRNFCIFGDIIALCKQEDEFTNICYGFGIVYEEPHQKEVVILSPVGSDIFESADCFLKSAVMFKASVILNHFNRIFGSVPHFCAMNVDVIDDGKRDLMKALFGLD